MYVGGTYARLVYSWYQNIFHMITILIVFHVAKKNTMKTILKQDSNSRQRQDIFPVSNLISRKIKTLLSLPIHLDHHIFAAAAVDPLLLRCRSAAAAVAPAVYTLLLMLLLLLSLLLSLFCCSFCRSCCRSVVKPSHERDCKSASWS